MKQFILKVSEWHALLFLTSLLLPPPLYFFLGQNYSENVFEFVNHFDSPSSLTFAGKPILCQKNCSSRSSQLLQSPILPGFVWTGLRLWLPQGHSMDGLEEEWARRTNLSLCPGTDGLWKTSEPPSLETEQGVWLQQRPPHRRSSSSGCGFQIWGECLEFWFSWKNLAFKARPLKVKWMYHCSLELSPIRVTQNLVLDSLKTWKLWDLQCNVEVWFFMAIHRTIYAFAVQV